MRWIRILVAAILCGLPWASASSALAQTADDDSLSAIVAEAEEGDLEAIADALSTMPEVPAATAWSRMRIDARTFVGHRSDFALRASLPVVAMGFRNVDGRRVGFVTVPAAGPLRGVHAGRVRVRFGEQLMLGRGFGSYPIAYTAAAAGAFGWSPSLSSAFGVDGIAASIEIGAWALQPVVARSPDGRTATWAGLSHNRGHMRMSAVAGWPGDVAGVPRTVSLSGRTTRREVGLSAEVLRDASGTFAAVRIARRRGWALMFFHAPIVTTTDEPLTDFLHRPGHERGASGVWRRLGPLAVSGKVLLATRVQPLERRRRRQLWLVSGGRLSRDVRWRASVYHLFESKEALASGPPLLDTRTTQTMRTRYRLDFEFYEGLARHRVRVDYLTGDADGVVVGAGSRLRAGRAEVEWRLAGYALGKGQVGYVSRPGPGPFESLSAVSGRGSDVSVRVRAHLSSQMALVAYYGQPHAKAPRFFVGATYRR